MTSDRDNKSPMPTQCGSSSSREKYAAIPIREGGEPRLAIYNEADPEEWVEADADETLDLEEMR